MTKCEARDLQLLLHFLLKRTPEGMAPIAADAAIQAASRLAERSFLELGGGLSYRDIATSKSVTFNNSGAAPTHRVEDILAAVDAAPGAKLSRIAAIYAERYGKTISSSHINRTLHRSGRNVPPKGTNRTENSQ